METVNERIKYLRKDVLRLTQEKFAADLAHNKIEFICHRDR